MTKEKEHINYKVDQQSKNFFAGGSFTWTQSKATVWSQIETIVDAKPLTKTVRINFNRTAFAIAASLLLLIGVGSFLRFYQITINTPAGQHQMALLPDGSTVNLNAASSLSYHPYWWNFKREIEFEGEGYFEVEKGRKFRVISNKGTTEVLGTSFNIFSRDEIYKVTCLTGSVKVQSNKNKTVVLKPNSKAEISSSGTIMVSKNIETYPEISWKNNIFLFTATPLREVFYEIERQFGVKISTKIDTYPLYSGNFSKNHEIEEVLSYVCPALGLEYIQKSDTEYVIIQATE